MLGKVIIVNRTGQKHQINEEAFFTVTRVMVCITSNAFQV